MRVPTRPAQHSANPHHQPESGQLFGRFREVDECKQNEEHHRQGHGHLVHLACQIGQRLEHIELAGAQRIRHEDHADQRDHGVCEGRVDVAFPEPIREHCGQRYRRDIGEAQHTQNNGRRTQLPKPAVHHGRLPPSPPSKGVRPDRAAPTRPSKAAWRGPDTTPRASAGPRANPCRRSENRDSRARNPP